jgi:molecular chaperone Hsp33
MTNEATAPAANMGDGDDLILPFKFDGADIRGRLARLGSALDTVLKAHDYPNAVAQLLGEALILSATIAGTFKFDGRFVLQASTDGPISLLIADFTTDGSLRGYARFDADAVAQAEKDMAISAPVPRLMGAGHLAFTVDQGADMESYQGVVAVEGATLADCAHEYLRQSEQLAAAVRVEVGKVEGNWRGGAIMLEQLAGAPADGRSEEDAEDDWRRALALLGSVKSEEVLDADLSGGALLYRLFNEDGVRVYEPSTLQAKCRCSAERMETVLASFGKEDLQSMVVDGQITATCEFCNAVYNFDPDNLPEREEAGDEKNG